MAEQMRVSTRFENSNCRFVLQVDSMSKLTAMDVFKAVGHVKHLFQQQLRQAAPEKVGHSYGLVDLSGKPLFDQVEANLLKAVK